MAHPRVIEWHNKLEAQAIVKELSDDATRRSFFEEDMTF